MAAFLMTDPPPAIAATFQNPPIFQTSLYIHLTFEQDMHFFYICVELGCIKKSTYIKVSGNYPLVFLFLCPFWRILTQTCLTLCGSQLSISLDPST